ncbi:hypothetical protein BKA82DRAFT_4018669 [Pisolithus tinctorius]|nr:hypothetical protein BKA82DRAFT_4018669 [Pisolithus tinctorius]
MPRAPKSVDQVVDNSTDLHTRVLRNRKIPTTKMAPPPEIKKDKPKPRHTVQPPEGWEEHMFSLRDRRRSLTPSVSVSSQNSTTPILQEDQVEGTPMEEDTGEAEAEFCRCCIVISLTLGFGAPPLLSSDYQDDSESSLPPSLPPAEDSSSDAEDEFPPRRPGRRVEHKPKSKGKSRAMDVDDSDIVSQDDHEHARNTKFRKTGNLSHAALDEIRDFATEVKAKAEELGCRHSKSPRDILVAAGLSVKPSHTKLNEANLFRSWYWATQPKPDGADRNMVNNIITMEYNQLMKDIPKDNTAARKEKLKAIYEWSESSSAVPTNKSVKSIAVRVHNAKTQFSRLAEAWSTLEDIEIAGVVMYVGQDPAGRQTSGIFGGSDIIRKYINDCAIDVRGLMDKYTAIFKCLRDGNGTEAGLLRTSASASSAPALELRCRMKEIPRDHNRRVFGSMMKEKLITALQDLHTTRGVEVGDPQKIIWQWLLEFIRRNSLVIINWPLGVPPPGPGFEYKKLKADTLRQLVVPYLQRKLGSMYDGQSDDDDDEKNDRLDGVPEVEIKPWNEDVISIRDVHPLKGEIALVKAPDGTVLCKVSDDPEWQKSREEEDPGMAAHHAQSGLPFPSRKRPRVEVTDNDTVPREASRSDCQMPLHDEGRDARPIAGDRSVVIYPAAFWSKLTGDMHRMHFVTHQHTQAARTLESPDLHRDAVPSRLHPQDPGPSQQFPPSRRYEDVLQDPRYDRANYHVPGPSDIPYNVLLPARHGSGRFPPSCQTYRIPSRPDHHVYHDAPYISDYYPPAQPTAQQWVDRGSAAQNTCLFFRDRVSRKMHLLKILVTVSNGQGLCDCFSLIGFFHMVRGVARLESKD